VPCGSSWVKGAGSGACDRKAEEGDDAAGAPPGDSRGASTDDNAAKGGPPGRRLGERARARDAAEIRKGFDDPFAVGVPPGSPWRGSHHLDVVGREDRVEGVGYFVSRSRIRKRSESARTPNSTAKVLACCTVRDRVGWADIRRCAAGVCRVRGTPGRIPVAGPARRCARSRRAMMPSA
jgi:hypothetical protein